MGEDRSFQGLPEPDLGDARLNRRHLVLLLSLANSPSKSIPEALGSEAATEACYRFLRNKRIDYRDMIEPHIRDLLSCEAPGPWLAIHDTTPIVHATAVGAEDVYELSKGKPGYSAHATLVVAESSRRPLGLAYLEAVERDGDDDDPDPYGRSHEARRWERGIKATAERLQGRDVVHVLDSEGDAYPIFVALKATGGQDFVVRAGQSTRTTEDADGRCAPLGDALPVSPVLAERTVTLSTRSKPRTSAPGKGKRNTKPRTSRPAKLLIAASSKVLHRPKKLKARGPSSLRLNVVHVWEPDPPEGAEPVEWVLWTTLPIETQADVERVIDIYVVRWLIEELNQTLKTACRFEKRRFESRSTSARALALFFPIAVRTLLLRSAVREDADEPAVLYLSEDELSVLGALVPSMPAQPTLAQVGMAVAKLGGHLKSNGTPGWRILARGMETLHQSVWAVRAVRAAEAAEGARSLEA